MAPTLNQLIGQNVYKLRSEFGATQARLAEEVTRCGYPWANARVGELENGERGVSVSLLIILAESLEKISGRHIVLTDLLRGDGDVWITNRKKVSVDSLSAMFGGDSAGVLATVDLVAEVYPTMAESRLGKRLGVSSRKIALLSVDLWGHSLDAESERRADTDASAQARGHITRQLRAELSKALEKDAAV